MNKVIVAGSRDITDIKIVELVIQNSGFKIDELVCGMARGVDSIGYLLCKKKGIPIKEFPADWNRYGKSAGFVRNEEMAQYATHLIAISKDRSPGTENMINLANRYNLKVFVSRL